jgi:hypothetical protein
MNFFQAGGVLANDWSRLIRLILSPTSGKNSLDGAGALANLSEPGIFAPRIRTFKQ